MCMNLDALDDGWDVLPSASVVSHSKEDEAIVTPTGGPAVPDDPVRSVSIGVISNKLDGVVHLAGAVGATSTGHNHAISFVTTPLTGVNGNTDRAVLLQGSNGGISILSAGLEALALGGRVSPLRDGSHGVRGEGTRALSAVSTSTGVRVVRVEAHSTSRLDVVKGIGGKSSVAALVNSVAAHKLLGGELLDVITGNGPSGLDGLGGTESPATSALSLVLDIRKLALVLPVVASTETGSVDDDISRVDGKIRGLDGGVNSKVELKLFLRVVSKAGNSVDFIVSKLAELSILAADFLDILDEDLEVLVVLVLAFVLASVFGLERLKALGKEEVGSLITEGVGHGGNKGTDGKGKLHLRGFGE